MKICFRHIGGPETLDDWVEYVEWPDTLRVPTVGEEASLLRGYFVIKRVAWYTTSEGDVRARKSPSVDLFLN